MTSSAHTAFAFCRECLRWEDAEYGAPGSDAIFRRRAPVSKRLYFTNLNSVTDAAQKWCDDNDTAIEIGYYGYIPGEWEVQVSTPASVESVQSGDLCRALLAACVEASRKLKATP